MIFLLAFSLFSGEPYEYAPADLKQVSNQSREPVMIMPGTFLREYDPVTIMYNRDMNPKGSGPLDEPEKYVIIKPSHPGEYRWLDPRTIEFRPTVPWKAMQTYTVKSENVSKTLTVLLMPPASINPSSGSRELDPVSRISLNFTQQIPTEVLAKLVSFEACPLPGIETKNCRSYSVADYTIKMSENSSRNSYTYWFIFKKPIPNGLRVRTTVRLSSEKDLAEARRVYFFETRKDFTIDKAGTYEYQFTMNPTGSAYGRDQALRLSQDGTLIIDFSARPASLTLSVKSFVSFACSKENGLVTFRTRLIKLTVEQKNTTSYYVPNIQTATKNSAAQNQCSFSLPAPGQQMCAGQGNRLVERYGPQHFPLSVNGIKSTMFVFTKLSSPQSFLAYPHSVTE